MLAAGFEECQSARSVLQSAAFFSHPAAAIPCTFGLSPKFSTPVEKTVENRGSWKRELIWKPPLYGAENWVNRTFDFGPCLTMNLWDEILARIETKVNRHSFYTWFRPTTFVAKTHARSPSAYRTRCSRTGSPSTIRASSPKRRRVEAAQPRGRISSPMRRPTAPHSARAPTKRPCSKPARRRRRTPGPAGSIRATRSTPSSSARRISSRTRRAAPSRKRRHARTTRCSSTAASAWARRT